MSDFLASFASLAIEPVKRLSHAATTSPAEWRSALGAENDSSELLKTLVYKPKTAKTATPVPLVVIARETDLLSDFFPGANKDSLSPLSVTVQNYSKITVALDSSLQDDSTYALHANSAAETIFLTGKDVKKIAQLDFTSLAATSGPATSAKAEKEDAKIEGAVQIAIGVKKEVDFAAWYTNVLLKADMLDYYSVSGCYILKPWSYSIWESIQDWFNVEIRKLGVQNSYFPMFVSQKVLEREKDHIEGFSPEVAWVTRAGQSDLEEPIAIRPTSETAMYPYYAKWIKSHRDLPLKLNQWNSVVRWEFKNPQPFLRTREFLWQEGHTAFLTKPEADKEVLDILDLYRRVYEELLAVPVIPGVKSEKEKFAGGLYTTTCEGFVPTTGRGIQGATSHCLGQNFSKPEMFDIYVLDPADPAGQSKTYVWQNSWGLSTRAIGVMVMTHGDNQVVVVPCGLTARTTDEDRKKIESSCEDLAAQLRASNIRAKADLRDGYTPGYKFNDWEQKGVPLRLEVGPKDLAAKQTLTVRRDTGAKVPIAWDDSTPKEVAHLLDDIQSSLFTRAKELYDSRIKVITKWEDIVPALDAKNVVVIPWCEEEACEDDIKDRSAKSSEPTDERAPSAGAKSLCIPFDQERFGKLEPGTKCPACAKDAKRWTMFGRSY
ncbi:prolyl-tRNA synthetase [Flagelloscypha sp. PMI_526]|nr:prolyl-tRNA synthetase [Flagelloscypha sp. PMI_526]